MLVESGCLRGDDLPLLSALGDYRTRRALVQQYGELFVAPNVAELVVLRAAGMAVTTAHGLRDASSDQLAAIEAAWRVYEPLAAVELPAESSLSVDECDRDDGGDLAQNRAESDHDADQAAVLSLPATPADVCWPRHLVIVGWTPSRLSGDPPANLLEVCMACAGANDTTGIAVRWETSQWRPSPAEIERVRHALRAGRLADLHEVLLDSACSSRFEIFRTSHVDDQPTFAAARAAHLAAIPGRDGRAVESTLDELRRNRLAAHDREFVQPLLARALAARNPMRRANYLAAADIARTSELVSLAEEEEFASGESGAGRGGRYSTALNLISHKIRLTDVLVRLSREMTR